MTARTRQVLSAMVLLLGLLAMHGLNHDHHSLSSAGVGHEMASMVSSGPYAHDVVTAVGGAEHALVAAPEGLGHDLTAVCLAILTTGSLLVLLTWTRRRAPARRQRGCGQHVPGATIGRRSPDLLALCINRT
jgi:hypothetical protein